MAKEPGAPSQREKQRAATRERLFNAAVEEFRRVGFASAQLDVIVKKAGVVRGTFYHHFPSKDHVLIELQCRFSDEIAQKLKAMRGTAPPLRDVLQRVVEGILELDTYVGETDLMRDVLAVIVTSPVAEKMAEEYTPLIDELEIHFREAAARGELRKDLESDQLASILLTSIFGLLVSRRTPPDQRRTDLESLMDVFLKGMSP